MPVDFKQIGDLVASITTCVGLVSAIYTFMTHLNQNTETSPLKKLRVSHQKVEEKDWERLKRLYGVQSLAYLAGLLIMTLSLFFFQHSHQNNQNPMIMYFLYPLPMLLSIYNMFIFGSLWFNMGKGPEDACFFLFQSTEIEVEADFDTVFAECQKALKRMRTRGVEFDDEKRSLEAAMGISLQSFGGLLHIQIEPLQNHQSTCYSIHVQMKQRLPFFEATARSSSNINQFVRQLMGGTT